jgi:ribosomal protein S17
MPKNRLYAEDGEDLGEIRLAVPISAGETIPLSAEKSWRVIDVLPITDEDSPLDGALRVEVA